VNRWLRVSEIMSVALVTAGPERPLREGARLMREREVGSVLVTTGSRLTGIVTERDLVRAMAAGWDPGTATLGEAMTAPVVALDPESDILYAARLMAERSIRHLPVVEQDTAIGIVSIRDIVRWGLMALAWQTADAEAREAFRLLGAGAGPTGT
jgi:CBS domain-containing protein